MKKKILLIAFMAISMISFITVYAGNINEAEQRIISVMHAIYQIDSAYYKVSDMYVDKAVSYLSRDDIDMSDQEVDEYISLFYRNLRYALSEGYLVKIGEVEKPPKKQEEISGSESESEQTDNIYEEESQSGKHEEALPKADHPSMTGAEAFPADDADGSADSKKENMISESVGNGEISDIPSDAETIDAVIVGADVIVVDDAFLRQSATSIGNRKDGLSKNTEDLAEETLPKEYKDYSNAAPLAQNLNIGLIALAIAVIILVVCIWIVIRYKMKDRKH